MHHQIIEKFVKKSSISLLLIKLETKQSFAYALNIGLQNINSDLTSRIDPDDLALPERVEVTKFIFEYTNIDILGSCIYEYHTNSKNYFCRTYPLTHENISQKMIWNNQIAHSSVTFRTSKIKNLNGYPNIYKQEDYALWVKALKNNLVFMNHPTPFVKMNIDGMFLRRGGFNTLKSEFELFLLKKSIADYKLMSLCVSLLLRSLYRIMPVFIKVLFHILTRKNIKLK